MATTDTISTLTPDSAYSEGGVGGPTGGPFGLIDVYNAKGIGFNKSTSAGAVWVRRLPAAASLGTGATLVLLVADDPNNPDPGKVAVFGINIAVLGSASLYTASLATNTALGTEHTATVTIPADTARPTTGKTAEFSNAITVANMGGAAAGSWVMIRVRRLGANASDTHRGRVVLLGGDLRDT